VLPADDNRCVQRLQEGVHYYLEDGLVVFTEVYLLERGFCCGNRCRHCPYDETGQPRPEAVEKAAQRRR
jgi:hypothetical protein